GDAAVFESGQGGRHQGYRSRRGQAERAAGRRSVRERQGAAERTLCARPLFVRSQEAVGIQEAVGLLQGTRGGARRQGVPDRGRERLPVDEVAYSGRAFLTSPRSL